MAAGGKIILIIIGVVVIVTVVWFIISSSRASKKKAKNGSGGGGNKKGPGDIGDACSQKEDCASKICGNDGKCQAGCKNSFDCTHRLPFDKFCDVSGPVEKIMVSEFNIENGPSGTVTVNFTLVGKDGQSSCTGTAAVTGGAGGGLGDLNIINPGTNYFSYGNALKFDTTGYKISVDPGAISVLIENNSLGQCIDLPVPALRRNAASVAPGNIPSISLRTVNYNLFGRWFGVTGYEGQNERLAAIPAALAAHPKIGRGVDVVTMEEAWCPDSQLVSGSVMCLDNAARNLLISAMAAEGWKYHTGVVDKPGVSVVKKQTGGGAIVFSRWPIDAMSQYVYDSCADTDCDAAKGAIYIRITKTVGNVSQVFNVFGTHLQAWSTPPGKVARQGQLRELHDKFLPAIGIPTDGSEPVIFQGDMNTDFVLYPEEVAGMKTILRAELPELVGDQLFSSDPVTNFLVGKDGAAKQDGCLAQYKTNVMANVPGQCTGIPTAAQSGAPFDKRFVDPAGHLNVGPGGQCSAYCPCCPHEMLDYILYSTEPKYLQPTNSTLEIIPLKTAAPIKFQWGWCEESGCLTNRQETAPLTRSDLSDHYPVVANFTFEPKKTKFPRIDGCKSDADCHLKPFGKVSCYCTGPGCTLNDKAVNGWDAGGNSAVNANCQFRASAAGSCFCRPGNS